MEAVRKPFQGVVNIVRFNWQFFLFALLLSLLLVCLAYSLGQPYRLLSVIALCLVIVNTAVPLAVSYYVYDLSGLYKLSWLDDMNVQQKTVVLNINAGFDETSALLSLRYPEALLKVYDFYDPLKHTEVSIKRARKRYPPFQGTVAINTLSLPSADMEADYILISFAAHEIRDEGERDAFFRELKRVLKPSGEIIVMEHLRDGPNLLAYNIGFLHFLSHSTWYRTFEKAGLQVISEHKVTPFISKFVLSKYGNAS